MGGLGGDRDKETSTGVLLYIKRKDKQTKKENTY